MEKISASDTNTSIIASAAYALPFITWIFGPILLYFEFRKKSAFIAFHSIYSLGTVAFASLSAVLPPIIGLPLLAIAGLLWLYGIATCAFGTTPLIFRNEIARLAVRRPKQ